MKDKTVHEEIFARGRLFELVHERQPDGRIFEVARRAPGVRLIIADKSNQMILLTKEFRKELNDWDYRLPGGKVFDSLEEYDVFRKSGDELTIAARKKAIEEAHEEAGIQVIDLELYKKSTLGATVEWDLFVFESSKWQLMEDGQKLEEGEVIEADTWLTYTEATQKILDGDMQEGRIALVLLQWISEQKKEMNH
ncbi:MAG: NUDIX domain-containing protein [Candidatus Saccharibacteria bacterium]|nr:MAG: NUDIX domain-containing protein [Candidatus Saccharibacteria bacterium]